MQAYKEILIICILIVVLKQIWVTFIKYHVLNSIFMFKGIKHLAFSNVTCTMLAKFCVVTEHINYMDACDSYACHESYFPHYPQEC